MFTGELGGHGSRGGCGRAGRRGRAAWWRRDSTGAAAVREDCEEGGEEDRDEGGAVLSAGKEQDLDEGGGSEDRAEKGQHTGTGETVPAMDMGAKGAGPVPQEEDAAVVWGVVHGDPLRVHVARRDGGRQTHGPRWRR